MHYSENLVEYGMGYEEVSQLVVAMMEGSSICFVRLVTVVDPPARDLFQSFLTFKHSFIATTKRKRDFVPQSFDHRPPNIFVVAAAAALVILFTGNSKAEISHFCLF